eukprot:TRINITY_DN4842_c0_g1_i12.p1 TRINITY_DN4842_c0_g1~~TRINITY_DN4842_c0_g1_i12.p1  ORF type:complete len:437 (+),score=153.21 TRINITY_DN4842_c0_g1_i12:92-1402(+)
MIRRPPRSTLSSSSAASDVYKRQEQIGRVCKVKLPKRGDPVEWLQKAIDGAINALTFVATPETSWEAVVANRDGMEYYGNQIIFRDRKTGNQLYLDFVDHLKQLLNQMEQFAKNFCPQGIEWNDHGRDTASYSPGKGKGGDSPAASSAAPKGKGGKKGPPKGGLKSVFTAEQKAKFKEQADRMEEQRRLDKEEEARTGVKKLSAREQLMLELQSKQESGSLKGGFKHIEKKDRKAMKESRKVVVVDRSQRKAASADNKKPKVKRAEVNARVGFDQLKLANCTGTRQQKERREIVVENEKKDAVTIMDCEEVVVDIKGTPKAVMISGCKKYHVTIPGCLTAVNIDNSQSGYVHLTGGVRTCQVDKCRDLDITVASPEAHDCKFISSGVSSMNVEVEVDGIDGAQMQSMAVAAQYVTKILYDANGNAYLDTEPAEKGE